MRAWWLPVLLAGCGGDEKMGGSDAPSAPPATLVAVEPAAPGLVVDLIVSTATVEGVREADVVPLAGGLVLSVQRDVGDAVRKGELLAVIDNANLEGAADRAKTELQRLEAQLETLRGLHARGAVSDRELSDAEFALQAARTSQREAARTQGQTRLVAPFDGVVAARNLREGQYAAPGVAAFRVVDPAALRAVVSLPERDLSRVHEGAPAQVVSAYDDKVRADATIERVAPVVDANTGTFRAQLALAPASPLRPGQFVSVQLEVGRREGVLTVAREAVVYEDGQPLVYLVVDPPAEEAADTDAEDAAPAADPLAPLWSALGLAVKADDDTDTDAPDAPPQVARRTPLRVGLQDPHRVEVLEGLQPGDAVIVLGQSNLRDGSPVTVEVPAPEAPK